MIFSVVVMVTRLSGVQECRQRAQVVQHAHVLAGRHGDLPGVRDMRFASGMVSVRHLHWTCLCGQSCSSARHGRTVCARALWPIQAG